MAGHGSGLLGFSVTFAVHLLASQFSKRPIISTAIAIIVIGTTLVLPVVHTVLAPPPPPAPTVPANWRSMR
jgi:hypothetical protein